MIRSQPSTKEYRENFDGVFKGRTCVGEASGGGSVDVPVVQGVGASSDGQLSLLNGVPREACNGLHTVYRITDYIGEYECSRCGLTLVEP